MTTIALLTLSNIFMTFAWYGHLKYKNSPLWIAVLVSWLIAFFEYCLQVPANRTGHSVFSLVQLKVIQEVITLLVFMIFTLVFFKTETLRPNHLIGFVFLVLAVYFMFKD